MLMAVVDFKTAYFSTDLWPHAISRDYGTFNPHGMLARWILIAPALAVGWGSWLRVGVVYLYSLPWWFLASVAFDTISGSL